LERRVRSVHAFCPPGIGLEGNELIDIRELGARLEEMKSNIDARGIHVDADAVLAAHARHKQSTLDLEAARSEMNSLARRIASAGAADRTPLLGRASELKLQVISLEEQARASEAACDSAMATLPNWLAPDTPSGATDDENVELRRWGEPRVVPGAKDHVELAQGLDLIDFDGGTKVTGPKFYFLKNEAVLLDFALQALALRVALGNGFTALQTPDLAKNSILEGSGFSPRGAESNIYRVADTDLSLVATAEITVGGLHSAETLEVSRLPLKYVAQSHCFRTEAGAGGRASKGLYRVHQFNKVEMFVVCAPEDSEGLHQEILRIEEEIYQLLGLPYRVLRICAGDLGAPAYKKYDIEAWMPGKGDAGEYGEVTSTSNCTDFQSRRLGIRFKDVEGNRRGFAHTLNGTAIAVSRTLLAVIENYQLPDGGISVPEALRPFVGLERIGPRA
jgi:seryl-tRNA synthetase